MFKIICHQVEKRYRNKRVLHSLTCSINKGKLSGLIGRNGAGKSTLLKLLAGHLKPTNGEITVFGECPFNNLKTASNIMFVEEGMTFPPLFTVLDIFKMAKDFYPNWQHELAKRLLDYANIPTNAFHHNLSKGQKSTFNLIYGLASRCTITLLDEPMNGMDESIRTDMYRAILKEYIAYPRTMIISSHHLNEMEHLLEEIILIDNGQIKLHASLDDVQQMLVRLRGDINLIRKLTSDMEVFFEKEDLFHYEVVVERNKIDEKLLQTMNILVQPVTASEVCKFMTSKGKGGIDDVFK